MSVFGRARLTYPGYVLAGACCWRRLNKRMHTKLLLVDELSQGLAPRVVQELAERLQTIRRELVDWLRRQCD